MRVAKDSRYTGCLVSDAILRRSPLKAQRLAADRLLVLPEAARVERTNVVEPCGQCRNFVRLVPWHLTDVVRAPGAGTPHLIVRHHEISVSVVAALLLRSLLTRLSASYTMNGSPVVQTCWITISVAIKVGHEAPLIVEGVLQGAGTDGDLSGEIA